MWCNVCLQLSVGHVCQHTCAQGHAKQRAMTVVVLVEIVQEV